jgi:hypothetical protein
MVEYLFDENFSVSRLDPDGKKFDKGNLSLALFSTVILSPPCALEFCEYIL